MKVYAARIKRRCVNYILAYLQSANATDFVCDAIAERSYGRIIPFPSENGHAAFPIVTTRLTL